MNKISGITIYYYFVCKRKLWYYSHEIQMEYENEDVMIGKIIDENSYSREKKHIMINETISVDFMGKFNVIHEMKKSKSVEEAGIWQLKYYIYYLKKHGVENLRGIIDYPKLKQRKEIDFTQQDNIAIENIIEGIKQIINSEQCPPVVKSKICKKCAYYELCYI